MAAVCARAGISKVYSQFSQVLSIPIQESQQCSSPFKSQLQGLQASAWSAQSVRRHVGADWPGATLSHGILEKHAEPRGKPGFVEKDQTKA